MSLGYVPFPDLEPLITLASARPTLVPHDHREYVEGCFRCDLSRDETDDV